MNIEKLRKIFSDPKAAKKWADECKAKGYSSEKIESMNREMLETLHNIIDGRKIETNNKKVWLKWSLDCGDYVEAPLKDNESVEIYLSNLGFCQVLVRDDEPVASNRYSKGSDFSNKAIEVYEIEA